MIVKVRTPHILDFEFSINPVFCLTLSLDKKQYIAM